VLPTISKADDDDYYYYCVYLYVCILNWPHPIGAFQDQSKQTMINKYSNKDN